MQVLYVFFYLILILEKIHEVKKFSIRLANFGLRTQIPGNIVNTVRLVVVMRAHLNPDNSLCRLFAEDFSVTDVSH
jgi:hypothetical protein